MTPDRIHAGAERPFFGPTHVGQPARLSAAADTAGASYAEFPKRAALLYVLALVAANQLLWAVGSAAAPVIAFALIGLDLSLRDRLHDRIGARRAFFLVLAASLASWMLNPASGAIALASFTAFALAGAADTLVYQALRDRAAYARMNASNAAGALVDSLIFPAIAFGGFSPEIFALQLVMKLAGGALWAYLLTRKALA